MKRKLTPKEVQMIQDACDDLDFKVYEQYSGRGMFGKNCFGFVTGAPGAELKFAVQMLQNIEEDVDKDIVMELLENMSNCAASDSTGRDAIYYYPRLEWNNKDCGVCGNAQEDCICEADDGK